MSISDKTRKLLWGRSGNRCAMCKNELIIDATAQDDESVVAEECHIISSRPNGPRYDPSLTSGKLDSYDNLMLLCRTHHKMVDDQVDSFTSDILRQMKGDHEVWVSQKLAKERKLPPVQLRRVKQNMPSFLVRVSTGKEIMDLVSDAMAYAFDHDELRSQKEVDVVGSFLQMAQDWGDIGSDLEAGGRVQTAYELGESLQAVEGAGFSVFGGREVQIMEGGPLEEPRDWPIAIMRVVRKDNPSIRHVNLDGASKVDAQQGPPTETQPGG